MAQRDATYLISFIATFDVWVGAAAWDLVAFALHQIRTIRAPRDAAGHQLQVALRNSSTPLAFVRNAFFIGWAWRKTSKKIMLKAWGLTLLPVVLTILFVAAGVASSRIAKTGDVLLRGGNCGVINPNVTDSADEILIQLNQNYQDGQRMTLSNSYAQECYSNPFEGNEGDGVDESDVTRVNCQGYTRGALNYTNAMVDCPLGETCATPQALRLDTGYLDSHIDFGINEPQENRVTYRKMTTCAPLKTEGFSSNAYEAVNGLGTAAIYSYGNNSYQPTRFGVTQLIPEDGATFAYNRDTYDEPQSPYYMM